MASVRHKAYPEMVTTFFQAIHIHCGFNQKRAQTNAALQPERQYNPYRPTFYCEPISSRELCLAPRPKDGDLRAKTASLPLYASLSDIFGDSVGNHIQVKQHQYKLPGNRHGRPGHCEAHFPGDFRLGTLWSISAFRTCGHCKNARVSMDRWSKKTWKTLKCHGKKL